MASAANYNKAKSQVISLLQASETAYATTVDGSKRQFASDTEIEDAILFADGELCQAIIESPGHPFSGEFDATSSSLTTGTTLGVAIPSHMGRIVNVTHCATTNGTFLGGIAASSREDVLEMIGNTTIFGTNAYQLDYYFIEDMTLYAVDGFSRIVYTDYTRTSSPQAPESYATGIVAGAVARLMKDGGDDAQAAYYLNFFQQCLTAVRVGAKMLPNVIAYK